MTQGEWGSSPKHTECKEVSLRTWVGTKDSSTHKDMGYPVGRPSREHYTLVFSLSSRESMYAGQNTTYLIMSS